LSAEELEFNAELLPLTAASVTFPAAVTTLRDGGTQGFPSSLSHYEPLPEFFCLSTRSSGPQYGKPLSEVTA